MLVDELKTVKLKSTKISKVVIALFDLVNVFIKCWHFKIVKKNVQYVPLNVSKILLIFKCCFYYNSLVIRLAPVFRFFFWISSIFKVI